MRSWREPHEPSEARACARMEDEPHYNRAANYSCIRMVREKLVRHKCHYSLLQL